MPEGITKSDLNVESKYSQIVELWNTVKYCVIFSLNNDFKLLPTINLVSLILDSFPFSQLEFFQIISSQRDNKIYLKKQKIFKYEKLQEEIKNMTVLKKEVLEIFDILW